MGLLRKAGHYLGPFKHLLVFVGILTMTTTFKYLVTKTFGWNVPPLTAWELAALLHVLAVAYEMLQFDGFSFATKAFNKRSKFAIFVVLIVLILLKMAAVSSETTLVDDDGNTERLISVSKKVKALEIGIHFISTYVMILPMAFFFLLNFLAYRHVVARAKELGIPEEDQDQAAYLRGLMMFVDAPVVLPFVVMIIYLKLIDRVLDPTVENTGIGIIACCLLIVSNLLTGVFDAQWAKLRQREEDRGQW